jgi:argininosuccinate synthase
MSTTHFTRIDGRIVLAYSGGSGSTAALTALARSPAPVIAVLVNLGQQRGLEGLRDRAIALGARRVHVVDARDEFLDRFVLPAVQIGHFGDLARAADPALHHPCIARGLADVAAMEDAVAIAHGARAGSASAARLEWLIRDCGFAGTILAAGSASDASRIHDQPAHATLDGWAHAVEGSGFQPASSDRAVYQLTRDPATAPGAAAVAISFAGGRPTAVNGVSLSRGELVEVITTIAGDHGVGRVAAGIDHDSGWRIVEAPAAVVLTAAFTSLCDAAAGPRAIAARAAVGPVFRERLRDGEWYRPAGAAVQAFVGALAAAVSGTAYLDLRHGACRVERVEVDRAAPVARRAASEAFAFEEPPTPSKGR